MVPDLLPKDVLNRRQPVHRCPRESLLYSIEEKHEGIGRLYGSLEEVDEHLDGLIVGVTRETKSYKDIHSFNVKEHLFCDIFHPKIGHARQMAFAHEPFPSVPINLKGIENVAPKELLGSVRLG